MDLKLIQFSSAIKRKKLVARTIAELKQFLSDIPDLLQLKNSEELTEICCNAVEYVIAAKSKKYHIDKKQVVFEIYHEIFTDAPLTKEEMLMLGNRIEYLHEKGLITGVSFVRLVRKGLFSWLKKKVLS